METYDPNAVLTSIDRDGRYASGNQPRFAQWNLTCFAETLLPLIDPDDRENAVQLATNVINSFVGQNMEIWTAGMRAKIGLASSEDEDAALINNMFTAMEGQNVDYMLFIRRLADATLGQDANIVSRFHDGENTLARLELWHDRLLRDPLDPNERAKAMNGVNAIHMPRNYRVQEALVAAEAGNMILFAKFLDVLAGTFTKHNGLEAYEGPAPDSFGPYKTFCGT